LCRRHARDSEERSGDDHQTREESHVPRRIGLPPANSSARAPASALRPAQLL
jgi:hypothetical protein